MGILDRFRKQTEKEQLEASSKQDVVGGGKEKKVVAKAEKEKPAKNTKAKTAKKGSKMQGKRILLRPVVSEKAAIAAGSSTYTFVVANDATKIDVRNAVRALYGVEPVKVGIMNMQAKNVRFGRMKGRRTDWKKAMVTLPKGKTISVHDAV